MVVIWRPESNLLNCNFLCKYLRATNYNKITPDSWPECCITQEQFLGLGKQPVCKFALNTTFKTLNIQYDITFCIASYYRWVITAHLSWDFILPVGILMLATVPPNSLLVIPRSLNIGSTVEMLSYINQHVRNSVLILEIAVLYLEHKRSHTRFLNFISIVDRDQERKTSFFFHLIWRFKSNLSHTAVLSIHNVILLMTEGGTGQLVWWLCYGLHSQRIRV
jgi:hypothetical protein